MRPAPLAFRFEIAFVDEFTQAELHGAGFAMNEFHNLTERQRGVVGGFDRSVLSPMRKRPLHLPGSLHLPPPACGFPHALPPENQIP